VRRLRAGPIVLAVAVAVCVPPAAVLGQADGVDEVRMMAEASQLEARGDLAGAEGVLLEVLDARPGSGPALLALERVLRQQNRIRDLPARAVRAVAEDPRSALLNQLLLRTYAALDQEAELEAAAAAWIAAVPDLEIPYREVARTWEARGDYQRARTTLEQGRHRVSAEDALALELGALYAALAEHDLAAAEWDRAIGTAGRGVSQVRRALRSLPDGGAGIIPLLVARLEQEPASTPRLAAGVELATAAGLEPTAIRLAERLTPMLPADERRSFLIDLGRRADGARQSQVARWAYGRLVADGSTGEAHAVQSRFAELSLQLGDTAAAVTAYGAVEPRADGSLAEGRRAAALRIELMATQDPAEARDELRRFREDHHEPPELDRVAEAVVEALLASGDAAGAEQALVGVRGHRTALLRGRLALARGDLEPARTAFLAAAPGLGATDATRVLSLVALLGRIAPERGVLLAEAMGVAAAGEPGEGIDRVVEATRGIEPRERAALLEFAAGMADAHGLESDARALRRTVVAEHPHSDEAPAALLALARVLGDDERDEALELLERLIVEYPRSALVPQARRELDRISRGGGPRHTAHETQPR
jgi:tetratricopeptide (TPR) repeat protein